MGAARPRARGRRDHDRLFLASRDPPWWAIGASLIAANILAKQIVAMAGSGYAIGLAIASYEWIVAAAFTLPAGDDYRLHALTGRHAAEWTQVEQPVTPAPAVLEGRRGSTGHQANPWFAVARTSTGEEAGPVWFGALAWSGSWRITAGQDNLGRVRIAGSFNP